MNERNEEPKAKKSNEIEAGNNQKAKRFKINKLSKELKEQMSSKSPLK